MRVRAPRAPVEVEHREGRREHERREELPGARAEGVPAQGQVLQHGAALQRAEQPGERVLRQVRQERPPRAKNAWMGHSPFDRTELKYSQ